MVSVSIEKRPPVIKGLGAEGPDSGIKEKLMLFGQFVGDWETEFQAFCQREPSSEARARSTSDGF